MQMYFIPDVEKASIAEALWKSTVVKVEPLVVSDEETVGGLKLEEDDVELTQRPLSCMFS